MSEVLAPTPIDIEAEFERGFAGLTEVPVALPDLLKARDDLIADIVGRMPTEHRRFLVSFKSGEPQWDVLGLTAVDQLPAVRWKMMNLASLEKDRRVALLARLCTVLGLDE
jgi:hypothetical protein